MSLNLIPISYEEMCKVDSACVTGPVPEGSTAFEAAEAAVALMKPDWTPTRICFVPGSFVDGFGRQAIGSFWVMPF